ncbi:MAG TPA: MASE4 domain-containing protein, partial [Burkholderiales bacterium]|nr:MASE4 domain-containing protein [Burkholderiales bacterium]
MPLSAVANARHIRTAVSAAVVCALVFAAIAPFAAIPLPPLPAFIPIYQSSITVNDGLTAALLLAHAYYSRSRPLLILACGYVFTTLITITHTLTFPGLFSAAGLLGAGDQTTAWLYMFWHAGFPLFVIAYVYDRNLAVSRRAVGIAVLGVAAIVGALTVLATALHDTLPRIMAANHYAPAYAAVIATVWACSGMGLYALWKKRTHSVLDVWLMLVLWVWIIEVGLAAVLNSGRFDLGFYAGRTFGLIASSILLYVVLFEYSGSFFRMQAAYAQLAESRAREAALKSVHEAHA